MVDLNKVLQEYSCDDCSLVFLDYKQFLLHRKYHTSLLRSVITEECLLAESCPLCLVKYFKKYKNKCLEDLLGSGKRTLEASEGANKSKQVIRCKYYPKCKAEFYALTGFTRHVKTVHNDNRPHACQQCNYSAARYWRLKQHLFTHVGYKMFKCHRCPKEFTSRSNLNDHLLSSHKEVNIESHDCSYCDKKFSTSGRLKFHVKMHLSSETYKCQLCFKEFLLKRSFKNHMKLHNDSYECKYCGHKFRYEILLKAHLDPEKESKTTLCCKSCPETFKNFNCLLYHGRSHREFLCEVCKRKYFSIGAFKGHLLAHGIKLESAKNLIVEKNSRHRKQNKCPLCPKEYRRKRDLTYHLTKHKGKEPHVCKDCGKRFMKEKYLRTHLNPEKETKYPLPCKDCSKTFNNINCLVHHTRTHGEEFLCEVCKIKCLTRKGFKGHLAKHGIIWDPPS